MRIINRIRDGIYNFSDSFFALLIILVAVFLIWWRIDTIMAYPKLAVTGTSAQSTVGEMVDTIADTITDAIPTDSSIITSITNIAGVGEDKTTEGAVTDQNPAAPDTSSPAVQPSNDGYIPSGDTGAAPADPGLSGTPQQ